MKQNGHLIKPSRGCGSIVQRLGMGEQTFLQEPWRLSNLIEGKLILNIFGFTFFFLGKAKIVLVT